MAAYRIAPVDEQTVDVTLDSDRTTRITLGELRAAASQPDRDLAETYGRILREAQAAVRRAKGRRAYLDLQDSINACTRHHVSSQTMRAFSHCVAHRHYTDCNPAAHGNVVYTETCRCGAVRNCAVNQQHEEYGIWHNPQSSE